MGQTLHCVMPSSGLPLPFKAYWYRAPTEFYIHGSVHRDSILISSNEIQQYAGVYLQQN